VRTNSAFLDSSSSCMVDGTQDEYTLFKIPVQLPSFVLSSQCVRRIVVLDVIAMDAAFGACALEVSRCHVVVPIDMLTSSPYNCLFF
jgi:hypothetical protein